MSAKKYYMGDGNEVVALIAYALSEVAAIYPITPSSNMGEWCDEWAAKGLKNIWGTVPQVAELQSEGGAVGAMHGALQTGTLATTFTASQGLLLMIPNMYKIAGELTPAVIHVSARSLAAHALSIFGDHADVMAVRSTGFAMLASSSVQEAHDFALIAHAATLEARVPFVHFFEGFRVSHEVNKIELIPNEHIKQMINEEFVAAHRARALDPNHPVIRGTAQNPDVYFQAREACNPFYEMTPGIVEKYFNKFAQLSGRQYNLVDYYGDAKAEKIIVAMGCGTEVVKQAVDFLRNKGEKVGVLQVRLFRPFPTEQLLKALPTTATSIAVLDRTKEPGADGEPLYQNVVTALSQAFMNGKLKSLPKIIGGRYGLSSKEFTPAMAKAIFDELAKKELKNNFTIGINDDVTNTSLEYDHEFSNESPEVVRALFFGMGSDGTVGANKNSIKIIGENTNNYAQGYFVYDSKKSGSRTVSHLRFGPKPINAPYLIHTANFIGCHSCEFLYKIDMLKFAEPGATFLLNCPYAADKIWEHLPRPVQQNIIDKKIKLYTIDAIKVARESGMGNRINTIMQTCFFKLTSIMPAEESIGYIKKAIQKTYAKKGEEIIKQNYAAVDQALANLHQVTVPAKVSPNAQDLPATVSDKAPKFVKEFIAEVAADRGDDLPVSMMPIDGTFPSATTQWEKRNVSDIVAIWDKDLCIQCGRCSLVCPHAVIRAKRCPKSLLANAPAGFKTTTLRGKGNEDKSFTLQVYLEDCTGCGLCHQACPVTNKENPTKKAINIEPKEPIFAQEKRNVEFFETLPTETLSTEEAGKVMGLQYVQPLFEFSGACAGCGETPYVKIISQLFGDRMLVANATGCSSIYGGNLPTTPWAMNAEGRGPAWSNSLFEDNAEFGFGYRLSQDKLAEFAQELLRELASQVGETLANEILANVTKNTNEEISAQRKRIAELKTKLSGLKSERAQYLNSIADYLIRRSVWIMGGDGWAYDIGYGGLDHVLANQRDVNVFVLDTEVYSNTGGQASKATPLGAIAKFAAAGKRTPKKSLAAMMMNYGHIYVAQIALGANQAQAIKAIQEAESYNGPSLIIAYSHCIAHGIKMELGLDLQKMAVESGYWPLFRFDPRLAAEGKNPFILDSKKPAMPFKDYAYQETRFKSLMQINPEAAARLLEAAQHELEHKWKFYEGIANNNLL